MKLIMAVSKDGFVARGPKDDMKWTGRLDKLLFKTLTCTDGGNLAAGSKTFNLMPNLPGRTLYKISKNCKSLEWFQEHFPNGWLIGGQTVALSALEKNLISEVFLIESYKIIGGGRRDHITEYLKDNNWVRIIYEPGFPATVSIWRKYG